MSCCDSTSSIPSQLDRRSTRATTGSELAAHLDDRRPVDFADAWLRHLDALDQVSWSCELTSFSAACERQSALWRSLAAWFGGGDADGFTAACARLKEPDTA
jgi:hypothetical protein